jgi:hypothetical protein
LGGWGLIPDIFLLKAAPLGGFLAFLDILDFLAYFCTPLKWTTRPVRPAIAADNSPNGSLSDSPVRIRQQGIMQKSIQNAKGQDQFKCQKAVQSYRHGQDYLPESVQTPHSYQEI